jgi:hypothetical protein
MARRVGAAAAAVAVLAAPCAGWMATPSHAVLRAGSGGGAAAVRASASPRGAISAMPRRDVVAFGFGSALLTLLPSEACADMTLNSFKRAYFRWVPRIEAGRDFFVLELGAQIEGEQWDEVVSRTSPPPLRLQHRRFSARGACGAVSGCGDRRVHLSRCA